MSPLPLVRKVIDFFQFQRNYSRPPHPCNQRLELWSNSQIGFERYYQEKFVPNTKDPDFLKFLGTAIHRINLFDTCIIQNLKKKIDDPSLSDKRDKLHTLRAYCRFHNDLVVSRVKHFFFREIPNQAFNHNFIDLELHFYHLGEELGQTIDDLINASDFLEEYGRITSLFAEYYYHLELLYDFIYNYKENNGAFLQFSYDRTYFKAATQKLRDFAQNLISLEGEQNRCNYERKFRFYTWTLLIEILEIYSGTAPNSFSLQKRFARFLDWYVTSIQKRPYSVGIEPLTWHLTSFIWKANGLLKAAMGYKNSGLGYGIDKYVPKLKNLVINSLEHYENSYKQVDYAKLYEFEANFISNISKPTDNEVIERLENIKDDFKELKKADRSISNDQRISLDAVVTKINKDLLKRCKDENEGKVKLESIIEYLDVKEIDALIAALGKRFQDLTSGFDESNQALVGFLSSGVFLGHLMNLYCDRLDRPIWTFRIYPYIAMQPLHKHKDSSRLRPRNLITLDESIKTGFSFGAYEAYLERSSPETERVILISLFNFRSRYKRIHGLKWDTDTWSLLEEQGDVENLHFVLNREIYLEKPFTLAWDHIATDDMIEKAKERATYKEYQGRFDLLFFLSNTPIVLSLGRLFAKNIIESPKRAENTNVVLFSPSDEGRVLAFFTAYFLKLQGHTISFFKGKKQTKSRTPEDFLVSIDLGMNTGFTLASRLADTLDVPLVWESQKDSFYKEVALTGNKNRAENFFNLNLTAWPGKGKDVNEA